MRRILILGLGLACGAGLLAACGDELPTAVGGDIIDPGFRTFDVVLDAATFLQADTTYDRLGELRGAPFRLVAEAFEGELFAHTLFRVNVPRRVTYEDEDGTSVTDSLFAIIGGTVTVVLDTLGEPTDPVEIEVVELTERWDAFSATWEQRIDSAGVSEPWTEPGGTTGRRLGSAIWVAGDTLEIPLDSAAAAVLTDSVVGVHSGLLRSVTDGTRVRIEALSFDFHVRPSEADTLLTAGSVTEHAIVLTPEASEPGQNELRVGGVPTWRSVLNFRPLSEVEIPCSPGNTTCTIPLSSVDLNLATLLLRPLPVGPRRIERPLRVEARAVLRAPGVPVSRSALSTSMGAMAEGIAPSAFAAPAEPTTAAVPITGYIRRNVNPPEGEDPILWVALVAAAEQQSPVFGYAAFGSIRSADPPRLRLVVTVPAEEELQ